MGEITNPWRKSQPIICVSSEFQQKHCPPPWGKKTTLEMKVLKNIFSLKKKKNSKTKNILQTLKFEIVFFPHGGG